MTCRNAKEVPIIWMNDGDDGNEAAEVTDEFIGITLWLFGMCMILLGCLLWQLSVEVCMRRWGGKTFGTRREMVLLPILLFEGHYSTAQCP